MASFVVHESSGQALPMGSLSSRSQRMLLQWHVETAKLLAAGRWHIASSRVCKVTSECQSLLNDLIRCGNFV